MKRLVLSIFLVFVASAAFAGIVTPDKAAEYAGKFFSGPATKGSPARVEKVIPKYHASVKSTSSEELFYIFNNLSGGGFVIISAEDAARPVIGYSLEESFPDEVIPYHIASWFRSIEDQIRFLRKNNIKQTGDGAVEWSGLKTKGIGGDHHPILQLETAQWNQRAPYSDKCPTNCVTGCVQTALAIKMKYHKHPYNLEKDIVNGYTLDGHWVDTTAKKGNNKYKWDTMTDTYNTSSTTKAKEAVAVVMADLGIMMGASYKTNGSTGALSSEIPGNMVEYMQYDQGVSCEYRDNYSTDQWGELLRKELENNGPIVYSGSSDSGGHCFILDGYGAGNYFSINWGWGGSYNGMFILDVFQSDGQGTGGNNGEAYSVGQDAQIGLVPAKSGSKKVYSIWADQSTITPDTELTSKTSVKLDFSYVHSDCPWITSSDKVTWYLDQVDYAGNIVSQLKTSTATGYNFDGYMYGRTFESITLDRLRLGDYFRLSFTIENKQTTKVPVQYPLETVRGQVPLIDASFIIADDEYHDGDTFHRNVFYGRLVPEEVLWTYDGKAVYEDFKVTKGKHVIQAILSYPWIGTNETIVREIVVE